jgi:MFS family permease
MITHRFWRLLAGGLHHHREFRRLLAGQTISMFGNQVTLLALPTVAIMALHCGPMELGLLGVMLFLPSPLLSMAAGVFIDRLPKRPVMVWSEVGRMLTLASVPVAFALDALTINQLYAVAFITGTLTVFFEVAYLSFLPGLVEDYDLLEGNTRLEIYRSVSTVAGPALAGLLIQILGAARAILLDTATFVVSTLTLASIRKPEPAPSAPDGVDGFLKELRQGMLVVGRNPLLRCIAACSATSNFGAFMFGAVILVFAYHDLHLAPVLVGAILAAGNVGFVLGAMIAPRIARRLGLGRTLALSQLMFGVGLITTPLALFGLPALVLGMSQLLVNLQVPIYNINQVALRQAITPRPLQARMHATMRAVILSTIPVGSFAGGWMGLHAGVVQTLLIGAAVSIVAPLWILAGPVIALKTHPAEPAPEPATPRTLPALQPAQAAH